MNLHTYPNKTLTGAAVSAIIIVTGMILSSPILGWLGFILLLLFGRLHMVFKKDGHYKNTFSGCLWAVPFLVMSSAWVFIFLGYALEYLSNNLDLTSPFTIILVTVLAVVIHIAAERLYVNSVFAFMSKKADDTEAGVTPPSQGARAQSSVASPPPALTFKTFDHNSEITIVDKFAQTIYNHASNKTGRLLFLAVVVAIVVNFLLSVGIMAYFLSLEDPTTSLKPEVENIHAVSIFTIPIFMHLIPFLLALGITILVYKKRRGLTWLLVIVAGLLVNLFNFFGLTSSAQKGNFPVELMLPIIGSPLWVPLLVFALIVVPFILLDTWNRGVLPGSRFLSKGSGVSLLILRVFGVDKNTFSLFSKLGQQWQFVGPQLTIVDPTYARFELRQTRNTYILIALAPLIFILSCSVGDLKFLSEMLKMAPIVFLFVYLPFWLFYLYRSFKNIKHQFAQNTEALQQRIEFESTADSLLSTRYQQGTLYCYDNLWKTALDKLVASTQLVLMDLRHFSATNKGCEYEINYLLNHFPLERTIFLIDSSTDQQLFQEFVQTQWQQLHTASPNRSTNQPTMTIYHSKQEIKEDVGKIIMLLSNAAFVKEEQQIAAVTTKEATAEKGLLAPKKLNLAILIGWLVIITGIVLQALYNKDGMEITSGSSVSWLGIIIVMLFRRIKLLLQRDGHLQGLFKGFPWPQAFGLIAGGWVILYLWINWMN